ncbi:hypothetical protein [Paenibacillus campi]|uniref:hypothetical protein n=1 Tax=Paenibacillus campi TaxID=3106031 RepID=UPI002AFF1005|nr:hypothetical protein [Paenibacillus sp. SGZ-1014]
MLETMRFVFFSGVETFAAFTLMLSIFRLNPLHFFWPTSFIFLVFSMISYLLRDASQMSYIVPALSLIMFALLIKIFLSVPILWSAIIGLSGWLIYMVMQAFVILTLFGSFTPDMQFSGAGTIIQIVSSAVAFSAAAFLQRFHIGFIADFERLRFKFEDISVLLFTCAALVAAAIAVYRNNLQHVIVLFIILAGLFIYYSIRKEREI